MNVPGCNISAVVRVRRVGAKGSAPWLVGMTRRAGLSHRGLPLHAKNPGTSSAATSTDEAKPFLESSGDWPVFLSKLFVCGAVSGTLLDGIHSRTGLQIYDIAPVNVGDALFTSALVPPLLGAFYLVLGALVIVADDLSPGDPTDKVKVKAQDGANVLLAYGVLAADLQLSAYMFSNGYEYSQISVALALATALTWWSFDRTKQGILLMLLCGIGAPLSELVLLHYFPLWHYPKADLHFEFGDFVSWVFFCYGFYTPPLALLARHWWFKRSSNNIEG